VITLFFQRWCETTIVLCVLLFGVYLWLPTKVLLAIPAAFAFVKAAFWWVVIISGIYAYQYTSEAHRKMGDETKRLLREKQD
jgi:hypothetical protein